MYDDFKSGSIFTNAQFVSFDFVVDNGASFEFAAGTIKNDGKTITMGYLYANAVTDRLTYRHISSLQQVRQRRGIPKAGGGEMKYIGAVTS